MSGSKRASGKTPTVDTIMQLVRKYDRNKTGAIEIDELREFLKDQGLLKGKTPREIDQFLLNQFILADCDKDNTLKPAEFEAYYKKITAPKLCNALQAEFPQQLRELQTTFNTFSSFGATRGQKIPDLGSAHWLKLCRDTRILPHPSLTVTDVDLAFMKAKTKNAQRLRFDEFVDALDILAEKRGVEVIELITQIIESDGPILNGTVVNTDRFYTTTNTTTKAAATGAESSPQFSHTVVQEPPPRQSSSQQHRNRNARPGSGQSHHSTTSFSSGGKTPSTMTGATTATTDFGATNLTPVSRIQQHSPALSGGSTGVLKGSSSAEWFTISAARRRNSSSGGGSDGSLDDVQQQEQQKERRKSSVKKMTMLHGGEEEVREEELFPTFCAFSSFGTGSSPLPSDPGAVAMDGKQFSKLCKEAKLVSGRLNSAVVDLCFSKAKPKGARKLPFSKFLHALALLASEKGCDVQDVAAAVVSCPSPRRNSMMSSPGFVRLHDDKSTFTGVYSRGGPSTVDDTKDLTKMLNRSHLGGGRMGARGSPSSFLSSGDV